MKTILFTGFILTFSVGFAEAAKDVTPAKNIECVVKSISKMGDQYTIKPKKLILTINDSANGSLYYKAELQYEHTSAPDDNGAAKNVQATNKYALDVTGNGELSQAVSREDKEIESTIAVSPFPFKTKNGKSVKTVLTMITKDMYFKYSPVKIDSNLDCVFKD